MNQNLETITESLKMTIAEMNRQLYDAQTLVIMDYDETRTLPYWNAWRVQKLHSIAMSLDTLNDQLLGSIERLRKSTRSLA
jgi:hypothetical protein